VWLVLVSSCGGPFTEEARTGNAFDVASAVAASLPRGQAPTHHAAPASSDAASMGAVDAPRFSCTSSEQWTDVILAEDVATAVSACEEMGGGQCSCVPVGT
jgi:hypothetical protein